MSNQVALATARQISYITSLLARRVPASSDPMEAAVFDEIRQQLQDNAFTVRTASAAISFLLGRPEVKTAPAPAAPLPANALDLRHIPTGRYAALDETEVVRFFKIDNLTESDGKWVGFVFVKIQAGDEYYRQGTQRPNQAYAGKSMHALSLIAANPKDAAVLYGKTLGICAMCGRTLTDPESIAAGIGPICAEKL